MSRAVRGVLRDATGPVTVAAIAAAVIDQRGLQDADQEVVRKRGGSALRNFKRREQATSRHGAGWHWNGPSPTQTGWTHNNVSV